MKEKRVTIWSKSLKYGKYLVRFLNTHFGTLEFGLSNFPTVNTNNTKKEHMLK